MSGIPVVASTRGGLPEAVGSGGIVLDPDAPIADWVAVIKKLWQDPSYYTEMSTAASAYANRRDITFAHIFDTTEQVLVKLCKQRNR